MKKIKIKDGLILVDTKDFKLVSNYKWSRTRDGYVIRIENKKSILLHRFLLQPSKNQYIDHINHNKLDNRRKNNRICTKSQNCMNRKKSNTITSGIVGVGWIAEKNEWRASLTLKGKFINLGYFKNKKDAIRARQQAEIKYFKEFRPI